MGGATVGRGQLAPTEMRLWGQNYVIAPTEFCRSRSKRYKQEILPPLAKSRGAAPGGAPEHQGPFEHRDVLGPSGTSLRAPGAQRGPDTLRGP